jgi:ATP phosphoribosyltransferase regulatory subunit
MTDDPAKALLPSGVGDGLPPSAAHEAQVIERLIACFDAYGYDRVKPPLIEFEDSLLSGPGRVLAKQTFRIMDPQSQRMMGVRPDMTVQVARIAATRLAQAPRPLRLSYAGQVLRVRGTQLRPERQFAQAGFELIGGLGSAGDAEVITLAAQALAEIGVSNLSIDLTMPTFVPSVCAQLGLGPEDCARARDALDRKDAAALKDLGAGAAELLSEVLAVAGLADTALDRLAAITLAGEANRQRGDLNELVGLIRAARPDLALTVDLGEYRGFEYQTGVSFTLFARDVRGELGRGGRYRIENGEPATGVSVYLDSVMRALAEPESARRGFLPFGTPVDAGHRLRADGWHTVSGLVLVKDAAGEACRLSCTHIFENGKMRALD